MNPQPDWISQADAALKRASLRARELAEKSNTRLSVMKGGKIVNLLAIERSQRTPPQEKEDPQ